ncbi:DUF4382 domain-containing protein [Oculatella sp. LEGE 06141]|uniref:DUF4382 domain-containing protein n=1 Tax=Oculatella sp. LEGE 06141 TaxID=1828648 RepID=UPI00187E79E7|nr:DUF4382 domain-containing protein [Oculatella sp. LEGE 06141]MBE9182682.1 DUF4382 domain-containing protein [Oculatella sp. LEGE 06141]
MKQQLITAAFLTLIAPALLQSCGGNNAPQAEAPTAEQANPSATTPANGETGTLEIRANGEDFVREGFTTKDGWEISFDHVYVTLADVTAYQTDPPFNSEAGTEIQATQEVSVSEPKTVDLAEGETDADPVLVDTVEAPAGRYNALSWRMVSANSGPADGYPLVMQGTATKDGETINFNLRLNQELAFTCGDFVGDDRKGILEPGDTTDLEATFHFDHLFGDGDAPPDDEINTGALGFDPLAALAQNGELDADTAELEQNMSADDYNTLLGILPSLGHVGEGHCQETQLTT